MKVKALPPSPSGTTRVGKSWSASSARAGAHPLLQGVFDRLQPPLAETLLRQGSEFLERALGSGFEPACLGGEDDAEGTSVVGVALAADQPVAFEEAHHRRHRLLAEPGTACEFADAQAVLFEQRHEDRAVARPHRAPAGDAEALLQELVPVPGRLGEGEAEAVPIHN